MRDMCAVSLFRETVTTLTQLCGLTLRGGFHIVRSRDTFKDSIGLLIGRVNNGTV